MSEDMFEHVLEYAALGWRLIAVHGVNEDGSCTCGATACDKVGKHPMESGWPERATSDSKVLEAKWIVTPNANIGLACGPGSGVVVLDVDPAHGGTESMMSWMSEHMPGARLNDTFRAETGGGGWHFFFRWPSEGRLRGRELRNRVGWLPGVEVKADRGQVVLAPSRHRTGGRYRWDTRESMPDLPDELLEALLDTSRTGRGEEERKDDKEYVDDVVIALNGVPEGKRDDVLYKWACRLMRVFAGNVVQVRLLVLVAAAHCSPPFPAEEAEDKVRRAKAFYDKEMERENFDYSWGPQVDADTPPAVVAGLLPALGNSRDEPDGCTLDDGGNADRYIKVYSGVTRWAVGGGWHVWENGRWKADLGGHIVQWMMERRVREIGRVTIPWLIDQGAPDDWISALVRHRRTSANKNSVRAAMGLLEGRPGIITRLEAFDPDPWTLNVTNGLVDLRTGRLSGHDAEAMCTKMADVVYDPGAVCPRWDRYLARVVPDEDLRRFLQEAVGYTLTGSTGEKCFFVLHGPSNTGKSVFILTLQDMLGEYGRSVSKGVFIKQRFEGHPTELASVRGARMITNANEIVRGEQWNEGRIKVMTGGERMVARFMHQNEFEFVPAAKLWISTNFHPTAKDFSGGLKSRLRIVPFEQVVPEEERANRDELLAGLAEERSGILNWALVGLARVRERGRLVMPEEVLLAVEEYMESEDVFGQFVADWVVLGGGAETFVSSKDLLEGFRQWAVGEGHDPRFLAPSNPRTLGMELRRYGAVPIKVGGHRGWRATCRYEVTSWT